ncbi:MAG: hypothetical protein HYT38_00890, partial [Candidatus Sungbacteria bacterium]|nr:hypothetical protein [Candidatus Sungbacteria bacterium]
MLEQEFGAPQSEGDFESSVELKNKHEAMFLRLSNKLDQIDDEVNLGHDEITRGKNNPAHGGIEVDIDLIRDEISEKLKPLVQEARSIIGE